MLTMEVSNNVNIVVERGIVHAVALLIIQYHSEDLECVWFLFRKRNIRYALECLLLFMGYFKGKLSCCTTESHRKRQKIDCIFARSQMLFLHQIT